jgi:chromosome segregation ATPase
VDELSILQEEIERLTARTKKQSNDMKDMQEANERLEERLNLLEKQSKNHEYEVDAYKQDLASKDKTIEGIKSEWTNNIRQHEDEIKSYKQNYQLLSDELTNTKNELNEFMSKISSLKQQVSQLNGDLEAKQHLNEGLNGELTKYEFICKDQEAKICQYSSELAMARNQLDNAASQINNANSKIAETEGKYEHALKNMDRLENNVTCVNELIMELKFKAVEKDQAVEMFRNENASLNTQLNNKNLDLKKLINQNETLNEELDKVNEECNKLADCLEQSEASYKSAQAKLSDKINDVKQIIDLKFNSFILCVYLIQFLIHFMCLPHTVKSEFHTKV